MQPAASGNDATGVKLIRGEAAGGMAPVNMEKFWKKRAEDIPVDEANIRLLIAQTLYLPISLGVLSSFLHTKALEGEIQGSEDRPKRGRFRGLRR